MTQLDMFGEPPAAPAPTPGAVPFTGIVKYPKPWKDAELEGALDVLAQTSIEFIIHRTMSLHAAVMLLDLHYLPEEPPPNDGRAKYPKKRGRDKARDYGPALDELKDVGCIRVHKSGGHTNVIINRERVIELARETDARLTRWSDGEGG